MKTIITIFTLFISFNAFSDSFSDKCSDIESCAKYINQRFGQKYIISNDVKGTIKIVGEIDIDRSNYEYLFSKMLNENGYTRVPTDLKDTYQIVSRREAKDMALPAFNCDDRHPPTIPNTFDLVTMKYKAKNPESTDSIARVLRNFMPTYSRIVSTDLSGMLIITDSAISLKSMYQTIVENDLKPTSEQKKKWEESAKRHQMMHSQKQDIQDSSEPKSKKSE